MPSGDNISADHLSAHNLTVVRSRRTVLKDVTAGFPRHASKAVVGPSGAGKSTLLRCLNRLEEPAGGTVFLDGQNIRDVDPTVLRCRVALIGQTPIVFGGGVRANLSYGMNDLAEAKMTEALTAVGLPKSFLERESSALSVGQAQRVCLARALVRDPEVLLLDEPTSALDRDAVGTFEALMRSLLERGLTIVLVTHDLALARRLAARAVLLVDGVVEADGTLAEVEAAWPSEKTS